MVNSLMKGLEEHFKGHAFEAKLNGGEYHIYIDGNYDGMRLWEDSTNNLLRNGHRDRLRYILTQEIEMYFHRVSKIKP